MQLALAVVLVAIGFVVISNIPFKHLIREVSTPSADGVLGQLTSEDPKQRRAGLSVFHYKHARDQRNVDALTRMALSDPDPRLRVAALRRLASLAGEEADPASARKPFTQETIDAVTGLLFEELDSDLASAVIAFVGKTAYWYPRREAVVARLTDLLKATEDRVLRQEILYALQRFARHEGLPVAKHLAVLRIYREDGPLSGRLVALASRVFYQASHRQALPDAVLDAVAAALRNHPNPDIRYNAIYTLTGQDRRSGEVPAALREALDDPNPTIRRKAQSAITLVEKSHSDYLDRLMATARDTAQPDSLRGAALSKAMGDYYREDLFRDTVLTLLDDDEPTVRSAAVRALPYLRKHPAYANGSRPLVDCSCPARLPSGTIHSCPCLGSSSSTP